MWLVEDSGQADRQVFEDGLKLELSTRDMSELWRCDVSCRCVVCAALLVRRRRSSGVRWLPVSSMGWRYRLVDCSCSHQHDPSLGRHHGVSVYRFMSGTALAGMQSGVCCGSQSAWCTETDWRVGSCTGVKPRPPSSVTSQLSLALYHSTCAASEAALVETDVRLV